MRGCARARSASARWPPSPDTARPPHSPVPSPAALVKHHGQCAAVGAHRCSQGPIRYRAWSCLLGALVIPPTGRAPWLLLLVAEPTCRPDSEVSGLGVRRRTACADPASTQPGSGVEPDFHPTLRRARRSGVVLAVVLQE